MKRWSTVLIAMLLSLLLASCGAGNASNGAITTSPSTSPSESVTDAPAVETDAPTEETNAPTESTDAPAESTNAPAESTDAPTESTDAPAESTDAPTESTDSPTESTDAPAESTDAPTESTNAPAESTDAPEESTDAPDPGPAPHVHAPVYVPSTGISCEEGGIGEYWYCEGCDTAFSDEECKNALSALPVIEAPGHDWDEGETVQEGSCTADGEMKYLCRTCSADKHEPIVAKGHAWDTERTCAHGHTCTACGTSEPALTHSYLESDSFEGNCTTPASVTYTCEHCKDTYTDVLGAAKGHVTSGVAPVERHVKGCEYVLTYACTACGTVVDGDEVDHHDYKASIKTPATCEENGVKLMTCACGDSYELPIEKNATGHAWVEGVAENSKRIDTCSTCKATKTVTVVTGTTTEKTAASDLANTEIQVNNANVSLDQGVVDALGEKEVTLSVGKIEGDDRKGLGIDETLLTQVGDNPIYDFTIHDGKQNISQFGEENFVTITVPYRLSEGEDVDSIAIWFINDQGELEAIDAVYNNGFVTFRTNHFSYYTVTLLSPEQRCEAWGHGYAEMQVPATCDTEGYTLFVCVRCHATEKKITAPAIGHSYKTTETAATCDRNGSILSRCEHCGDTYSTRIPATGHAWKETGREAASCRAEGHITYGCTNDGCKSSYVERLARLPHVYESTVGEVSCETPGYTLHSCTGCDASYVDSFVPALGHDLTSTVTPPTCTELGYTTHVCGRCDYSNVDSYQNPTGHSVTVTDTPASCEKDGLYLEACSACDYEVREVRPATGHLYASVITPAGCETEGYTTHTCSRCQNSYKDSFTAAKGHNYITEWTWSASFDAATLTLTCRNDRSHTATVNATVREERREATCKEEGSVVYTASVTHGGKDYTSSKTETLPKGEHVIGTDYLGDATHHWHSCAVCSAPIGVEKHVWNAGEVVETPTCSASGKRVFTCTAVGCGYEKEEHVPPTGEHVYENGVCVGCGRADDAPCDHTVLHTQVMDMGAHGFCAATFNYESCECGEYKRTDVKELQKIGCHSMETVPGADGMSQRGTCRTCGMFVVMHAEIIGEGCAAEVRVIYDFYRDGEVVLGNLVASSVGGTHVAEEFSEDLSVYGFCGGVIGGIRCSECGELGAVKRFSPTCKNAVSSEDVYVENGVEHRVSRMTCPDCGLDATIDRYLEPIDACMSTVYQIYSLYKGETLIMECEVTNTYGSHDDVYSYDMLGDTCADGVTVHRVCQRCKDSSVGETYFGHVNEWRQIDASEFTPCGGYLEMSECRVCGAISNVETYGLGCCFVSEEHVEGEGDDHSTREFCMLCGLERLTAIELISMTECVMVYVQNVRLVMNGEELLSWSNSMKHENHNYEYVYDEGGSCEEGYSYTATCTRCGDTHQGNGIGHTHEPFSIDFSEHGACMGYAEGERCSFCGETSYVWVESDCRLTVTDSYTQTVDGIPHTVTVSTCRKCGTVHTSDTYSVPVETCIVYNYERITYAFRDGESDTVTRRSVTENHDYDYEFEDGADCESGKEYNGFVRCRNCSYESYIGGWGHCYLNGWNEIELSEQGACGGAVRFAECAICHGTSIELENHCYIEELQKVETPDGNGVMHTVEVGQCHDCGFTYSTDTWEGARVGCISTVYVHYTVQDFDGDTVYEGTETQTRSEHDMSYTYVPDGDTCDEGYWLYGTCASCFETSEEYRVGCMGEYVCVDLSEQGACGGSVEYEKCKFCERVYNVCTWDGCERYYDGQMSEALGQHVYRCSVCGTIRLESETSTDPDEHCEYTVHKLLTYAYADGTPIVSLCEEVRYTSHTYEYVYELYGASCEDGGHFDATCKLCGDTYSEDFGYHMELDTHRYTLCESHGGEGHFNYSACPCGERSSVYWHLDCHETENEYLKTADGTVDIERIRCVGCDTVIEHRRIGTKNGCRIDYVDVYSLYVNGETVVEGAIGDRFYSDDHDYEYVYVFDGEENCEDGVTCYMTCDCGAQESYHYEWHECYEEIFLDLSLYGGCPESYFHFRWCGCGQNQSCDYAFCSDMEEISYESGVRADGSISRITTYECGTCGVTVILESYVEKRGCYRFGICEFTVKRGDEIYLSDAYRVESIEVCHNDAYTYELYGESCEDGVKVSVTCADCGRSDSQEYDWHETHTTSRLELSDYGLCYGYIETFACPCGEHQGYNEYFCNNYGEEFDVREDSDGVMHTYTRYTCSSCGMEAICDRFETGIGTCEGDCISRWTISVNGETVIKDREFVSGHWSDHAYVYTLELLGQDCDDGYIARGTCTVCQKTETVRGYGHTTYPTQLLDLEAAGACHGVVKRYSCACGECVEHTVDTCGMWSEQEKTVETNGTVHYLDTYRCDECGLVAVSDAVTLKSGCLLEKVAFWTVTLNGEVLIESFKQTFSSWYEHKYEYTFSLNGESCYDGYHAFGVCECGATSEGSGYDHDSFAVYYADAEDLGACQSDVYLKLCSCPCGKHSTLEHTFCKKTEQSYTYDEDVPYRTYTTYSCPDCGLGVRIEENRELDGCEACYVYDVTVTKGNETVKVLHYLGGRTEEHDFDRTYTMLGESCEDGVEILDTCKRCGHTVGDYVQWHSTARSEYYNLSEYGACYGDVHLNVCYCGREASFYVGGCAYEKSENTYTDGEGRKHFVEVRSCETCGLRIQTDRYSVKDRASCTERIYHSVAITVGKTAVALIEYVETKDAHDTVTVATLTEGASCCLEGYTVTTSCKDCDYESFYENYGKHETFASETYDLCDYGMVCGGTLYIKKCACGEVTEGDAEVACDLDVTDAECWIDGVVNSWYGQCLTCAVTEPACGFSYRYATYYLPDDGCHAREYVCWQLGYDPVSGTCQKEIVYETGAWTLWHDWEYEKQDGTDALGAWEGGRNLCSACGSFESWREYYDANGWIVRGVTERYNALAVKDEVLRESREVAYVYNVTPDGAVNRDTVLERTALTLANGKRVEQEMTATYDYTYSAGFGDWGLRIEKTVTGDGEHYVYEDCYVFCDGYSYTVREYYADPAKDFWHLYEYDYQRDCLCYYTCTYTDSYGKEYVEEHENHRGSSYVELSHATCTQFGRYAWQCDLCKKYTEEASTMPTGHLWVYDATLGHYRCDRCALENANGADGDVIFEDLTAEHGNGTDYVIGYYAETHVSFDRYVSLRILDASGAVIDEIILQIKLYEVDGLRAFAFSRKDVEASAEYYGYQSGEYLVAFTFVPVGADGSFDYSITLTE